MDSREGAHRSVRTLAAARLDWRWRMWAWAAVGLLGFSVVGLIADACGTVLAHAQRLRIAAEHPVSLASQPSRATVPSPSPARPVPPLRVAITPHFSPAKALAMYQELADLLGEATERPATVLLRSSYGDTCHLARTGECDVAFVGTAALAASTSGTRLQTIAAPMIRGQARFRSYVIVRRRSRYQCLLDLQGARFASADLLCTSGWLFPASWLESQGVDPEQALGHRIITGSHDRAIEAVRMGYADAAAVASFVYDQLGEEDAHVSEDTRIILKSPLLPSPPVVVRETLDGHTKEVLRQTLLAMHEDVQGGAVLSGLGFDRFVEPDERGLQSVRSMLRAAEGAEP